VYSALGTKKWLDEKKFAENHSYTLPLILGKWNYFKEKGVDGTAEKRLDEVFNSQMTPDEVYEDFFLSRSLTEPETLNKWIAAIRDDNDIRSWVTEKLQIRIRELDEKKNELQTMLRRLEEGV